MSKGLLMNCLDVVRARYLDMKSVRVQHWAAVLGESEPSTLPPARKNKSLQGGGAERMALSDPYFSSRVR